MPHATTERSFDLQRLIHPHSTAEFLREYLEKQPLLIARSTRDYFRQILTLEDLERNLSSHATPASAVLLVRDGAPVSVKGKTSVVDVADLVAQFRDGATVILNAMNRFWPSLSQFCRNLEIEFHHPVHANVYLTPEEAQGFRPHFDTHDVFVLQIAGAKSWKLYDVEKHLPFRDEPSDISTAELGEPRMSFDLLPGDALYIPRGLVHEARTTSALSLHITVGVSFFTWYDFFRTAIRLAADICPQMRESLPIGFLGNGESVAEKYNEVAPLLIRGIDTAETVSVIADALFCTRPGRLPDRPRRFEDSNALGTESRVSRYEGLMFRVFNDQQFVVLSFDGKSVRFPAHVHEPIRFITERQSFRICDLPGSLNDGGKLTLVRRLIREGFLSAE